MLNKLRVVIVGAGARDAAYKHPASAGQTPSLEAFARAKEECQNSGYELSLHLVDPRYEIVKFPPLETFGQGMKDEYELLQKLSQFDVEIVPTFYRRWNTKDTHKLKEFAISPIGNSPDHTIFISYLGSKNEYDFMFSLDMAKTKGYFYIVGLPYDSKCPIDEIVNQYLSGELKEVYDVFSGELIPSDVKYDEKIITELILEGATLVRYHIQAGTLEKNYELPKINVTIPDWCYQIETPFLKGVICYYGIKNTEVSDKTNEKEMRSSAQSRKTFISTCSKVVCNYVYHNNILNDSDIEQIINWESLETYNIIVNALQKRLDTLM